MSWLFKSWNTITLCDRNQHQGDDWRKEPEGILSGYCDKSISREPAEKEKLIKDLLLLLLLWLLPSIHYPLFLSPSSSTCSSLYGWCDVEVVSNQIPSLLFSSSCLSSFFSKWSLLCQSPHHALLVVRGCDYLFSSWSLLPLSFPSSLPSFLATTEKRHEEVLLMILLTSQSCNGWLDLFLEDVCPHLT